MSPMNLLTGGEGWAKVVFYSLRLLMLSCDDSCSAEEERKLIRCNRINLKSYGAAALVAFGLFVVLVFAKTVAC